MSSRSSSEPKARIAVILGPDSLAGGSIMTAPLEVELKLELPPSALPQFRKLPLIRALQASAKRSSQVSVYFDGDGEIIFRHACSLGCEGIVSKRLGSAYRHGRPAHAFAT